MRSRRVFRFNRNLPRRDLPQMKVKPRKLKVSGFPSPRTLRSSPAERPNSISRVFSGCSDSANSCSRARISSRKRRSEEHTSELQSPCNLVCRLLLEKKKQPNQPHHGTSNTKEKG